MQGTTERLGRLQIGVVSVSKELKSWFLVCWSFELHILSTLGEWNASLVLFSLRPELRWIVAILVWFCQAPELSFARLAPCPLRSG